MVIKRQDVVETALRLLADHGLEGLSMRRLAEAMRVQAPSLYWHFPNKQALLDDMADVILSGVAHDMHDLAYDVALRRVATELRQALLYYRDGALIVISAPAMGKNASRLTHLVTNRLMDIGFDAVAADHATSSLRSFVLGFVVEEQSARSAAPDRDAHFAFGLDLLMTGLEHQRRTAAPVDALLRAFDRLR